MVLSFGSVFICVLIIFFLYIYFVIILYANSKLFVGEIRFVFVGVILLCFRTLLPFNFPFSVTIPIEHGLLEISDLFLLTEIQGVSLFEGFLCVWIWGVILKSLNLIWKYYKFSTAINQAASIEHLRKKQISDVLKKYGIKNMQIVILPNVMSPAVCGILKPVLLMPDYDFSTDDLHYIISHEVTHLKKCDLILKLFLEICTCIYWWYPIMYLFKAKFFLAVEIANDISVIKDQSNTFRLKYIECLILTSRLRSSEVSLYHLDDFEIPFIKRSIHLKIRVKKILSYANGSSIGFLIKLLSRCFLIAILSFGIFIIPEASYITPDVENTTFTMNADNSYLVRTDEGFDLYVDNNYVMTFSNLDDEYMQSLRLKIYKEKR